MSLAPKPLTCSLLVMAQNAISPKPCNGKEIGDHTLPYFATQMQPALKINPVKQTETCMAISASIGKTNTTRMVVPK